MEEHDRDTGSSGRPEVFWILFVLVSAGVFLAVLEPARREAAAAHRRLERMNRQLEGRRRHLEDLRRIRQALERGDPEAWEAVARARGMGRPGELRLAAPAAPQVYER